MFDLSERASRGVALAALTVACVLGGPAPQLVEALERIYAVAVVDDQRRRRRPDDRVRGWVPKGPRRARRPLPVRP